MSTPRLARRDRLDDNGEVRRTCNVCGNEYRLTKDNFYSRANHFSGLELTCKACCRRKWAVEKKRMRDEQNACKPVRENITRPPTGLERRLSAVKAEAARKFGFWETVRPGGFAISAPGW